MTPAKRTAGIDRNTSRTAAPHSRGARDNALDTVAGPAPHRAPSESGAQSIVRPRSSCRPGRDGRMRRPGGPPVLPARLTLRFPSSRAHRAACADVRPIWYTPPRKGAGPGRTKRWQHPAPCFSQVCRVYAWPLAHRRFGALMRRAICGSSGPLAGRNFRSGGLPTRWLATGARTASGSSTQLGCFNSGPPPGHQLPSRRSPVSRALGKTVPAVRRSSHRDRPYAYGAPASRPGAGNHGWSHEHSPTAKRIGRSCRRRDGRFGVIPEHLVSTPRRSARGAVAAPVDRLVTASCFSPSSVAHFACACAARIGLGFTPGTAFETRFHVVECQPECCASFPRLAPARVFPHQRHSSWAPGLSCCSSRWV